MADLRQSALTRTSSIFRQASHLLSELQQRPTSRRVCMKFFFSICCPSFGQSFLGFTKNIFRNFRAEKRLHPCEHGVQPTTSRSETGRRFKTPTCSQLGVFKLHDLPDVNQRAANPSPHIHLHPQFFLQLHSCYVLLWYESVRCRLSF